MIDPMQWVKVCKSAAIPKIPAIGEALCPGDIRKQASLEGGQMVAIGCRDIRDGDQRLVLSPVQEGAQQICAAGVSGTVIDPFQAEGSVD